jgi:hypothetical protein
LKRFAGNAGLVGDGFGGLASEAGKLALKDDGGVDALLRAFEQGEVVRQKGMQAAGAGVDLCGDDSGCLEQRLLLSGCSRMVATIVPPGGGRLLESPGEPGWPGSIRYSRITFDWQLLSTVLG